MTAVLINFIISDEVETLKDEGATLGQTLLPYLNRCLTFQFINSKHTNTALSFIQSLATYIRDTNKAIDRGLASFILTYNPEILSSMIIIERDSHSL